jgi:SAM-dependent methyltransferase
VEAELARFAPAGRVLELACGTGLWTRHLARWADRLTAVDASPEVLAINRARVGARGVEYVQADLFAWEPDDRYDACFFGFWVSHVPEDRFAPFWAMVTRALRPGGRVFFVDSADREGKGDDPAADPTMVRRLDDGREFRIVKRFYDPAALERRLAGLGWTIEVRATREYFIHGAGARPA